ncbi:MAG TPA: DNA-formamidopyrimidine glycosylase family protein [Solirubrobacteraceae bacterium]
MPEGDTIAWTANRIRPVLEGRVPDEISSPRNPRWPGRLAGQAVTRIDTYGKHLLMRFEGGLVLHSHLGMSGSWRVALERRAWRRAWIVLRVGDHWVVELDGPTLELMTDGRVRFDQRIAGLGPDVLAPEFDVQRFLARLRADDPTRPLGDALLDQRNVAGIGNIWKAEGCWEGAVDPWRPVSDVSDEEALAVITAVRPRMMRSAIEGPRAIQARVYGRRGRPCPRCGGRITSRGQGDANRTTYWCPKCQNSSRSEFAPGPDTASSTK